MTLTTTTVTKTEDSTVAKNTIFSSPAVSAAISLVRPNVGAVQEPTSIFVGGSSVVALLVELASGSVQQDGSASGVDALHTR